MIVSVFDVFVMFLISAVAGGPSFVGNIFYRIELTLDG